jgi:hypothetical protein
VLVNTRGHTPNQFVNLPLHWLEDRVHMQGGEAAKSSSVPQTTKAGLDEETGVSLRPE